tara:strand:+ start:4413 stop:5900 length:1488 start_codon:yes stop_codon:yes gene_type:complete
MPKYNLLDKKFKKQLLSINNSLENSFNKIKVLKSNIKKLSLTKDNKVFLGIGIFIILSLSYFLIPSIYNKDLIKDEIKNHLVSKYEINLKFNNEINYSFLPKPHYIIKDLSILNKDVEIGKVGSLKIFITINNFFSSKNLKITDIVLDKTEFNINKDDLIFFQNLLNSKPSKNKINIKNSVIFYKNENDEVLFINKIFNSKFYYDSNYLENILTSKNEIFNVPYTLVVKKNEFNKTILTNFKSRKLRVNIENKINYENKNKKGNLDILLLNKDTSLRYEIQKDLIKFKSNEIKNSYDGIVELKPFYLNANFYYEGISTKDLFDDNSIFFEILKSEILNNKNLSTSLNLNIKKIVNIDELKDLFLQIGIEDGNFNLYDSSIMWKDDLKIKLLDSQLSYDENEISLLGRADVIVKDIEDFYKSFQIKKESRKSINKIQFDFYFNFDQQKINFDNVKIDNNYIESLDKFINNFNSKGKILNKIMLRNFINDLFDIYAG